MDGRYRTKFTACYHATIHVGDSYTDDLLVMLQVVPLLLYCWIEKDHFIAHEVNNFFIDKLSRLLVLVLCSCALGCQ